MTDLIASLELEDCAINFSWAEPKSVFRRVMTAAMVHEGGRDDETTSYPYYEYAIAGIIVSVGGKAESIQATIALLDHAKESKGTPTVHRLGRIL